jgi:type IV secretion system protein TrbL
MGPRLRWLARAGLAAALAVLLVLGRPAPEQAKANSLCEAASAPAGAVTGGIGTITGGAIGGGNPVGDACNSVTDGVVGAATAPLTDALKGVGTDIFNQITAWVTDGAAWLMGRVAKAIDTSTGPRLDAQGFVRQYRKVVEIAVVMAAAMLLLAVLEGLAQGSPGMLARAAFVNLPLAFLGASIAFVVVQLLIGATDGLSHAMSSSTGSDGQRFFGDAIKSLSAVGGAPGRAVGNATGGGGSAAGAIGGAGGSVEVPLFVTFLAAVIGAFAAFFVWIELLMRDAAIYAVALFVPLSLAASIWPRWSGALRRTAELLVVVIASKFVIVAIVSLAASLASHNSGQVEQILAAAALMLLACFSPIVLLRLVPFAEGAMAATYSRRSATGGALNGAHLATQVQMMRNMARANWRGSSATETRRGSDSGGGSRGPRPGGGPRGGSGGSGGPGPSGGASAGGGAAAGASVAAGAAPAAAIAVPAGVAKGSKAGAEHLGHTASAETATARPGSEAPTPSARGAEPPPPQGESGRRAASVASEDSGGTVPEPRAAKGGEAPGAGRQAPRPEAEPGTPRPSEAKRGG